MSIHFTNNADWASITPMTGKRFDFAMLLLRVGAGLSLCLLFGVPKVKSAVAYMHTGHWPFVDFNRKMGLPAPTLIAYFQTLNESAIALLVACGLWTRYAACSLVAGFAGATLCSLKAHEPSWITAFYLALIFAAIALLGSGNFAVRRDRP